MFSLVFLCFRSFTFSFGCLKMFSYFLKVVLGYCSSRLGCLYCMVV